MCAPETHLWTQTNHFRTVTVCKWLNQVDIVFKKRSWNAIFIHKNLYCSAKTRFFSRGLRPRTPLTLLVVGTPPLLLRRTPERLRRSAHPDLWQLTSVSFFHWDRFTLSQKFVQWDLELMLTIGWIDDIIIVWYFHCLFVHVPCWAIRYWKQEGLGIN